MNFMQALPAGRRTALALALVLTLPAFAEAQNASEEIPKNAHKKSYASGWECDVGFRESSNGKCVAVQVPANAYANSAGYGRGWECSWGFREAGEACQAIAVPDNGFLNPSGSRWECLRGFRKVEENCVAVDVPANAFLVDASFGRGWKCERGFREIGTACEPIVLPKNAHLDYSGNDWECNRPYRRQQDVCIGP